MRAVDTMMARGSVVPHLIDIKTGKTIPFGRRHNTLSFAAADAMAAAFSGDLSRVPNRIGIIYGADDDNPALTISRDQSWSNLKADLTAASANVQIRPFSFAPSLNPAGRVDPGSSSSESSASSPAGESSGSGSSTEMCDEIFVKVSGTAQGTTLVRMVRKCCSDSSAYDPSIVYEQVQEDASSSSDCSHHDLATMRITFDYFIVIVVDFPDASHQFTITSEEFRGFPLRIDNGSAGYGIVLEAWCASSPVDSVSLPDFGGEDGKDYWGVSATSGEIPYKGNSVTFHMHSDSTTPGIFDGPEIFSAGNKIFQAVLLNVRPSSDPEIIARVDLADDGVYRSKPEGFEIALDWTIRFF